MFKDLSILHNYLGIEIAIILAIRYDFETLIPFLCSTYENVHPFEQQPSKFGPQKQPLVVFDARLIEDQIVMEHASF